MSLPLLNFISDSRFLFLNFQYILVAVTISPLEDSCHILFFFVLFPFLLSFIPLGQTLFHYVKKQHKQLLISLNKNIDGKTKLVDPIILIRLFYQNENDYPE